MGVLVFVMAVLPSSGGSSMHMIRAEVPGPTVGKLVSKMSDTAKILYGIYLGLTVLTAVMLLCGGMSLYDSCINAFGCAGTGGFSNYALSIGHYNNLYFEIVIGTACLLFGINFNMFYFLLIGRAKDVFKSEELRTYLCIIAGATLLIAANITQMYGSFWTGLRHAYFQVASIITTTGFSSVDFTLWPSFSQTVLVLLMFLGACAGSTGGGIKITRLMIYAKTAWRNLRRTLHPNAVETVHFEGKRLDDNTVRSTHVYLVVYLMIFVASLLLISLEGFDFTTNFTSVIATMNNIGPGLGEVAPVGSFAGFSDFSKIVYIFDMLAGRLEVFPMLVLFAPATWRK
jgi:trk system potassium uptake protein TrkH